MKEKSVIRTEADVRLSFFFFFQSVYPRVVWPRSSDAVGVSHKDASVFCPRPLVFFSASHTRSRPIGDTLSVVGPLFFIRLFFFRNHKTMGVWLGPKRATGNTQVADASGTQRGGRKGKGKKKKRGQRLWSARRSTDGSKKWKKGLCLAYLNPLHPQNGADGDCAFEMFFDLFVSSRRQKGVSCMQRTRLFVRPKSWPLTMVVVFSTPTRKKAQGHIQTTRQGVLLAACASNFFFFEGKKTLGACQAVKVDRVPSHPQTKGRAVEERGPPFFFSIEVQSAHSLHLVFLLAVPPVLRGKRGDVGIWSFSKKKAISDAHVFVFRFSHTRTILAAARMRGKKIRGDARRDHTDSRVWWGASGGHVGLSTRFGRVPRFRHCR